MERRPRNLDSKPAARYRDLRVWNDAMELAVRVYIATEQFPPRGRFGLARQMRDAATSVPSNIAEGYRRGGRAFLAFLKIAAGSQSERETRAELAHRVKRLDDETAAALQAHASRVGRQLRRLRQSLGGD